MAVEPGPLSFQEALDGNHCYVCGKENDKGFYIRSYWDPEDGSVSVCRFTPAPHHSAMPPDVVNGGILASIIDCHCVCTAIADAYRRAGREVGEGELIWYATGTLSVKYVRPTPISGPFTARARITDVTRRRTTMEAEIRDSSGEVTVEGEVTAVRVPDSWANPAGLFAGS